MGADRDKHEQYREHVADSLGANPWARVIKVSDLPDNVVGLFHTSGPSLPRRASKYRSLVPVLREFVLRPDTSLGDDVKRMIAGQLDKAGDRLAAICGDPHTGRAPTLAISRLGDRIEQGPAASFRCARCGELAGMVRATRTGTTVNMGPPFGNETTDRDGLVLDYFLGTAWHAGSAEVIDAVQALIDQGHVDPAAIRDISWTLWEVTPFYCLACGLNYCSSDWDSCVLFDEGFYDCAKGNCPKGHQHVLDD